MKSEPDVFSIDDLRRKKVSGWDGVRNYQARNFMRAMRKGDGAFFYHSNATPSAIVGLMEIAREAYPDPTHTDTRLSWDQVDVRFKEAFAQTLTLPEIRGCPELQSMVLVQNSRLSVQPVTAYEWDFILRKVKAHA